MNTQPTEKKFDPTQAGPINIVACDNGWALYYYPTNRTHLQGDGSCFRGPSYVFTSAAELGLAVANLVQFGTVTRPEETALKTHDRLELTAGVWAAMQARIPEPDFGTGYLWFLFQVAGRDDLMAVQVWRDADASIFGRANPIVRLYEIFQTHHILTWRIASAEEADRLDDDSL